MVVSVLGVGYTDWRTRKAHPRRHPWDSPYPFLEAEAQDNDRDEGDG